MGARRDGAPEGHVYRGGYACLGKGQCPSNYHTNHRDRIHCEGPEINGERQRCYQPYAGDRWPIPDGWPAKHVDIGDGQTIDVGYSACVTYKPDAIPTEATGLITLADGDVVQVCPVCKGNGDVPNPAGPERFDLVHTDGYALKQQWL